MWIRCKDKRRCIQDACFLAPFRVRNGFPIMSTYLSCVREVVALQLDHISSAFPALVCLPCQNESSWTKMTGLLQAHRCLI